MPTKQAAGCKRPTPKVDRVKQPKEENAAQATNKPQRHGTPAPDSGFSACPRLQVLQSGSFRLETGETGAHPWPKPCRQGMGRMESEPSFRLDFI